ncbi:MAG TPA: DUF1731 domain-containing protein [Pirellulales bacterium]|nr:DUF1731 domain-containing protein [Pirellulales bacterium]
MRELRRAMGMPLGLPASAWMVRLGAPRLMRTDPELALYGRYLVSKRLEREGFEFRFSEVGDALKDVLTTQPRAVKPPVLSPGRREFIEKHAPELRNLDV